MKKTWKKALATALSMAMLAGLTACGAGIHAGLCPCVQHGAFLCRPCVHG